MPQRPTVKVRESERRMNAIKEGNTICRDGYSAAFPGS
jgi:hypothetical protein